jgi:hypothetical protein
VIVQTRKWVWRNYNNNMGTKPPTARIPVRERERERARFCSVEEEEEETGGARAVTRVTQTRL